jgi:drug/metabolite transporter (DMT)-like permease
MQKTDKNIFYILMLVAMLGWGASWVNVKFIGRYVDEYEMMFLRFGFTSLTLLPLLYFFKKSFKLDLKTFFLAIVSAIINMLYMKYFFLGAKFGSAGLGGALVTTLVPINTFIIMALFFSRKVTTKDTIALLIGAFGVLMMLGVWTLGVDEVFKIYNLYFIVASLLWPILTIVMSKSNRVAPLVFIFYMYLFTTLLTGVFFVEFSSIKNIIDYDFIFWLNILMISIGGTTYATSVYFLGIEKLGTNEVSSFIFLVPFFAIGLSYIFLNEKIGSYVVIGTIMAIVAVSMLNNIKIDIITFVKKRKQK